MIISPNRKSISVGDKVSAEYAKNLLEKRFTSDEKSKRPITVLLVDELDMLWNRKQSVLYNIFDWPTYKTARLVVLAIANTMDLPVYTFLNVFQILSSYSQKGTGFTRARADVIINFLCRSES